MTTRRERANAIRALAMTMEAVQWQRTDVIILGMIVIGLIWVVMDRTLFTVIERRTVGRWGLLQR